MEKEKVNNKIIEVSRDGKISCKEAFKIAEECECGVKEVGEACNNLKIKIMGCQLGCF